MEDEREDIIRHFHTEEEASEEEIEIGTRGGQVFPPGHEAGVTEEGVTGELGIPEEARHKELREGMTGRLAGEYEEEEETFTETPGVDEEFTTSSHNEEHHEHLSD